MYYNNKTKCWTHITFFTLFVFMISLNSVYVINFQILGLFRVEVWNPTRPEPTGWVGFFSGFRWPMGCVKGSTANLVPIKNVNCSFWNLPRNGFITCLNIRKQLMDDDIIKQYSRIWHKNDCKTFVNRENLKRQSEMSSCPF